jgi:hypothetical protein
MQQDWDDRENQHHSSDKYWHGGEGIVVMSPVKWLSHETGIDVRRIEAILRCETRFTILENAELLLIAVGRPDLLSPGGLIEVVPNPMISPEKWQAWYDERTCGE